MDMTFNEYVEQRKAGFVGDRPGDPYAFPGDLKVRKALRTFKPVELAISNVVQLGKGVMSGDLLGSAIKVGPNQYPRLHAIVTDCARTLGIPAPTVYVQGRIDSVNAYTFGTDKESVIVVHSVTLDHLDDDELKFVIGHECGHIHNGHVVYLVALNMLTAMANSLVGWFARPALLALQSWSRAAEITCDRAGLLCCRDVRVAQRAFLKLVAGSKKMFAELNEEQYLDQLREGRESIGRAAELTKSHPYIPKRIEALRLFSESDYYRRSVGIPGGAALGVIDKQVEEVVRVV